MKTSKLCVTCFCEGNSPMAGEFPTQLASNAENVSIWWRHHIRRNRLIDVRASKRRTLGCRSNYVGCHFIAEERMTWPGALLRHQEQIGTAALRWCGIRCYPECQDNGHAYSNPRHESPWVDFTGHRKLNCFQSRTNFHRSRTWHVDLIFNTAMGCGTVFFT